jgi:hypothetical protein
MSAAAPVRVPGGSGAESGGADGRGVSMCPKCGNQEAVLQSVTSNAWQCLPELGGCGATFDTPGRGQPKHEHAVEEAVSAMVEAIRQFEHDDWPLGQASLLEMERRTALLLDVLKCEIGRLTALVGDGGNVPDQIFGPLPASSAE